MVKKIILASGGTAGHIFPAESLGTYLEKRGYTVIFMTDKRGKRFLKVFQNRAKRVWARTPSTRNPFRFLGASCILGFGFLRCLFSLIYHRPAAVIGFGGYPSFPTLAAAKVLRIPLFIQEQNTVIGRVNRLFSSSCHFIFTSVASLKNLPPNQAHKIMPTGMPMRPIFDQWDTPYEAPSKTGPFHLLVFGGSQGSRLLTTIVPEAIRALPSALRQRLILLQQCATNDIEQLKAFYTNLGVKHKLTPFFEDMAQQMAWTHLIISRAGAMTVHEVERMKRPALFVPLGAAIDNDQLENAQRLVEKNQAFLCLEKNFSAPYLTQFLTQHMQCSQQLSQIVKSIEKINKTHFAEEKMVELIEKVIL